MRAPAKMAVGVVAALSIALVGMTTASGSSSTPDGNNEPPGPSIQASPNPTPAELVFVPLTPCRIVDTRVQGGALASTQTRTYYVAGTTNFPTQGGKSGGCGIPSGAAAVTATFTAVSPSHAGYLRVWPAGETEPGATLLNYATFSTGTGTTAKIAGVGGVKNLAVKNYGGPTQLVIDVNGYYVPQLSAFVNIDGTLGAGSSRVLSSVRSGTGYYIVTFDRPIASCSFQVTPFAYNWEVAVGPYSNNGAAVFIHDNVAPYESHDTSFFISAVC